ncbi:hypothetical protein AB1Y20_019648 [Prymnesium parvum]|uniref:Uncharacterized protein n=1 Tax=Prymnesium parvum TaxID=97485 RepID=A0AB34JT04_PRYPA
MSSFNVELQKYKDERAAFKDAPLAPRTIHTQIVANPNHVDDVHADITRVFCEHAGIVFENQGLGKLALQLAHPSRDNIPEKTYQRIYDEQEAKCSLCERDILRKTTEPGDRRSLVLTMTGNAVDEYVVSFQCKSGVRPTGVSAAGFFSDVHELLGIIPSRTPTPVNGQGGAVGVAEQTMPFPAQLNTLEGIYLRTSLNGGNFMSFGYNRNLPDNNSLIESDIMARIPLNTQAPSCIQLINSPHKSAG